ncbi:hypothetical protein [Streptomyces sp. AP-93]|uniref:hypothetical protein n=1 Tax=Streptomyces sp. AP-93 TaxID=2929048 RepID=UPI001FAFE6D2|nr:hypothetical protein [Streptomyces sp. AP-93]MCJ0868797.1 hypothetical protein [Streptomyces sp. AP-93]
MGGVRRVRTTAAAALAALAALGLVAALPGAAAAAGTPQPVPAYRGADGAQAVAGKPSTAGAPELKAGAVYKDSMAPGERYYRLNLDDSSTVYVSAVLQPPGSAKVSYSDGLTVDVLTIENRSCMSGPGRADFGYDPVPLSAVGARVMQEDAGCQTGGTYYVKVTRETAKDGDRAAWPLELRVQREPKLGGSNAPVAAPSVWPSASPTLPGSDAAPRSGGTGFNDARALGSGVWSDALRPGQTLFYRVPLDWGQQLGLAAELSAGTLTKDSGYASPGLSVALYSPYRSLIDGEDASYDGKQAGLTLPRTPPVAYENRFASDRKVGSVRVAGWYYVAVTMAGKVGDFTQEAVPVPLTLRTQIIGDPGKAPAYAEDLAAAGFGVGAEDRTAAKDGTTAVEADAAAANRSVMRVVASAGFGMGTLLLLVLGGWILLARRRSA